MKEGKIFLIDDDPSTLQLYSLALENAGFKVQATSHVIGTVNKINEFEPDIILIEVMLPALAGDHVVKILKSSIWSNPSIILMSYKGEDELRKLAKDCGADDFITKMSGPNSVLRKVNEKLARKSTAIV